jgi:hypothetical protein
VAVRGCALDHRVGCRLRCCRRLGLGRSFRRGRELPRIDVCGDIGELAAGRDDEPSVLAAESLADVADEDLVGRIGDRHDRELPFEGVGKGAEEPGLLLGEQCRRGGVDDLLAQSHELEALLAREQASQVDLGDEPALGQDFAEPLARLDALLEGALNRFRRQEAGPEDERSEGRVGPLAERSAHRLSVRPRGCAALVARGMQRVHVMSRRGAGLPRLGLSIV